jgi:hypothetical protein
LRFHNAQQKTAAPILLGNRGHVSECLCEKPCDQIRGKTPVVALIGSLAGSAASGHKSRVALNFTTRQGDPQVAARSGIY